MANNFHTWLDAVTSTNCQSSTEFALDSQRQAGFAANTKASSKRVNSALREATLIACGLMDAVAPNNTSLHMGSSRLDIANAIKAYKPANATRADTATTATTADNALRTSAVVTNNVAKSLLLNASVSPIRVAYGVVDLTESRSGTQQVNIGAGGFTQTPVIIATPILANASHAFVSYGVTDIVRASFKFSWYGNGTDDKIIGINWIAIGA